MSRVCQISGKKVLFGNNVSHSQRKTRRPFYPNLTKKKFFIEETGETITLKISNRVLRTIDKKGISAVIKEAKAKGTYTGK